MKTTWVHQMKKMKLKLNKKGQAGLTLIEVTLVIAVLLGLISVLFIGVAAYKKGSDRAKCILNISTVQKAARSYQNLYDLRNGDALAVGDIAGAGKMIETTKVAVTIACLAAIGICELLRKPDMDVPLAILCGM